MRGASPDETSVVCSSLMSGYAWAKVANAAWFAEPGKVLTVTEPSDFAAATILSHSLLGEPPPPPGALVGATGAPEVHACSSAAAPDRPISCSTRRRWTVVIFEKASPYSAARLN